jgi:hypothetical protein
VTLKRMIYGALLILTPTWWMLWRTGRMEGWW